MQKYWLRSVWRSKAMAILGGFVTLLALFSGFPVWLERGLYFVFGLLIVIFGLAGIRPEGETPLGAAGHDNASSQI